MGRWNHVSDNRGITLGEHVRNAVRNGLVFSFRAAFVGDCRYVELEFAVAKSNQPKSAFIMLDLGVSHDAIAELNPSDGRFGHTDVGRPDTRIGPGVERLFPAGRVQLGHVTGSGTDVVV